MAAYRPVDYSKWANLEVSDDEDEDQDGTAGGPLPPNFAELSRGTMPGGQEVSLLACSCRTQLLIRGAIRNMAQNRLSEFSCRHQTQCCGKRQCRRRAARVELQDGLLLVSRSTRMTIRCQTGVSPTRRRSSRRSPPSRVRRVTAKSSRISRPESLLSTVAVITGCDQLALWGVYAEDADQMAVMSRKMSSQMLYGFAGRSSGYDETPGVPYWRLARVSAGRLQVQQYLKAMLCLKQKERQHSSA